MSGREQAAEIEESDEEVCGYSLDHDEDVVYEDDECLQWVCRR